MICFLYGPTLSKSFVQLDVFAHGGFTLSVIVASYLKLLAPAKVFCMYLMLTPGRSFRESLILGKRYIYICIILQHGGKWTFH